MIDREYSIETINNKMTLRLPQFHSLEILDDIMSSIDLKQDNKTLEQRIHERYPIFREFERSFPSLTFALATGATFSALN